MMSNSIRIGTRDSELALWQATTVQRALERQGFQTELIPVKAEGDLNLDLPLYEMGVTGIFTKTLDIALLNHRVDIAVHSLKDAPTQLPKGIVQTAVLKRAAAEDVLVTRRPLDPEVDCKIATGSLRRKAQWLHRYPHHEVVGLRGNVNTRLQKLEDSDWNGAIFAKAGLERIDLLPDNHIVLDWMIPAPAQGAMAIMALESNEWAIAGSSKLNDENSELCTYIERQFLRVLEGGCTAPIGAIAKVDKDKIHFKGILLTLDGKTAVSIENSTELHNYQTFGNECAEFLLEKGGRKIMKQLQGKS